MNTQKEKIIQTSMRLFSENGYHETSMQAIAKACGISKGSLYNSFSSKEDLYMDSIEFFQHAMFQKAQSLDEKHFSTKKETFIQKLIIQIEDFLDKRDFILLQFRELPIRDNQRLQTLMEENKNRMMHWHKNLFTATYGHTIQPYIWDIVIMFEGMMKEYLQLLVHNKIHLSIENLARFLSDRMDVIIDQMNRDQIVSILPLSFMGEESTYNKVEHIQRIISDMKEVIHTLTINKNEKQYYVDSINLLEQELQDKHPRLFLLRALLTYVKEISDLRSYSDHLEQLLTEYFTQN
ncbi:TetR family transcriptional regulator [Pontibacillus yanchengensis]|uniref:TetR family transcriptional regulator n=2 Tax=Pontibacillus yanchengensis TaxID=462910 RepID=A0ACC7VBU0_9BACI|nr:TetR/AcrR family transcriptional regulator [Pontibacillus yanchengensis]MYL35374.1 TetR family transcriptional regulator [Pontibacillus yanchengensis]MYL52403.1 TetR family transcriptional regulator [Pontibacillus yanchengensis]